MFSEADHKYMQHALELAEKGRGKVSPNPMVGCVIVHNEIVIGEGYHKKYGGLHAEPNAVNSVQDKSLIAQSTIYVTLEPCSHYGKTPPCADLLADLKPQRVVIAAVDSNPMVAGRGVEKLKDAGIKVESGLLAEESRLLNRRFFVTMEKNRPFVILKWAQTTDGFIARENYDSKWISCEASRKLVHEWRAEEDAIMVGTNTALYDNPSLNVRLADGDDPLRILIDRNLKVPLNFNLYNQSIATIVYNGLENKANEYIQKVKIDFETNFLDQIMADLNKRKVQSVIVEGGTKLLNTFIKNGLWDEARVFVAPYNFDNGIAAPQLSKEPLYSDMIDCDQLHYYTNE